MPLTSRERLTRLFNNQDIDRMPVWLLAPFHRLGCYADIYNLDCYKPLIPYIEKYCDTFDRRQFNPGFCYNANPDITSENVTETKGDDVYHKRIVRYQGKLLCESYTATVGGNTIVKKPIESTDELARILEVPYVAPTPDISNYAREKAELGDNGLMMLDLGDPLIPLYHLMSAEEFAISTITDYDTMLAFTDEMERRVLDFYRYFLERDIGEVFFIVGCEFAGPPLVNPAKFNELSVRYVKKVVDLVREYGKKSIVHYHGQLFEVLSGFKEMNPDGLHTIEAPPIGNCTIPQARNALGDMILIGNIQYDDLIRKSRDEIVAMTKSVVDEGKSGRFILSPTAGPYETFLSEKTINNYIAMIETGVECGAY